MDSLTRSLMAEGLPWEPPDWLLPESEKVAVDWWEKVEELKVWPESFIQAFMHGYCAGYERGQRRRKVDGSEDT